MHPNASYARSIAGPLLILLLAGCSAADGGTDAENTEQPPVTQEGESGPREPLPRPEGENTVGARIFEYEIEVTRDTVEAGEITFHVVNAGTTEHWLIVRNETEFFGTPHLMPGESAVLTVTLEPGDYHLVCTIRDEFDHISEGERRDFVVR